MADINWHSVIAISLAAAFGPSIVKACGKFWAAVERHDERKRLRYEAKRAARLERKAARKAAKEAAKGPYYTSAVVVPPPRLGHDSGGDQRTSDDSGGPHQPG